MNLNEYKGLFLSKSPSSSSHSYIPNTAKLEMLTFVIANIQSFTSQIFGVVGLLGENLDYLDRRDLTFKQILITKLKNNQALLSQSFKTLSE